MLIDIGEDNMNDKISVSVENERCFFHVLGDNHKFYDLYSLQMKHSELNDYCKLHKLELQSELLKQNELLEDSDQ